MSVTPLPGPEKISAAALPNRRGYEERINFHRFAAAVWATLAKDARDMLAKETFSSTRHSLEGFIERSFARALHHYQQADETRRRGHA